MALTATDLREHLNGVPEADSFLSRLLTAASSHVGAQLGADHSAPDVVVDQAVLMLSAHWYENREASVAGVTMQTVPLGFDEIIREHRNYTYGLADEASNG